MAVNDFMYVIQVAKVLLNTNIVSFLGEAHIIKIIVCWKSALTKRIIHNIYTSFNTNLYKHKKWIAIKL